MQLGQKITVTADQLARVTAARDQIDAWLNEYRAFAAANDPDNPPETTAELARFIDGLVNLAAGGYKLLSRIAGHP